MTRFLTFCWALLLSASAWAQTTEICYQCNDAAITLDGRYLVLMPGCKPEIAFDLHNGKQVTQNLERLMVERGIYPLKPVEPQDIDSTLFAYLTKQTNTRSSGYYIYKLPGTGWIARYRYKSNCHHNTDGSAFYAGKFEAKAKRTWLAKIYVQQGIRLLKKKKFDDGMISFQKAVAIDPLFSRGHYNLACAFALQGKTEAALSFLKVAIHLSKHYAPFARRDRDFKSLRNDPRFKRLVLTIGPKRAPFRSPPRITLHTTGVVPDMRDVFKKLSRRKFAYNPALYRRKVKSLGDLMAHGRFLMNVDLSGSMLATWQSQKTARSGIWKALKLHYRGLMLIRTNHRKVGGVFAELHDAFSKGKSVELTWFRSNWRKQKTQFVPQSVTPPTVPVPVPAPAPVPTKVAPAPVPVKITPTPVPVKVTPTPTK